MPTVVDRVADPVHAFTIICDCSPPRGGDPALMEDLRDLRADFLSVAYNPGKAVRGTSVAVAAWLKHQAGRDVTFTLATRDMNRLALQSLLLGAQLLDLENVVVVQGDRFTAKEREHVQPVPDIIPTELLDTIAELNAGQDYRGRDLAAPAAFCAGATMDLGRDGARELALTRLKVEAGAQFFLLQALFQPERLQDFLERYAGAYGESLTAPVFCGVQVLTPESLVFGDVPDWMTGDLKRGRPAAEIGLQLVEAFGHAGFRTIYLIPPILRGGRRDYRAAQAVIDLLPARGRH